MKLWSVMALAVFVLSASVVNAQTQTAQVRGTVLDPSGARIPGVDVKLSQGSTLVAEGKSDATGNFSLAVAAGEYRLEISTPDFRPYRQNIRATVNMRPLSISLAVATVNAVIDVGQPDDKVSVEDDAKLSNTTIAGDDI